MRHPLTSLLPMLLLANPAWAQWEPDPAKEYILTNLAQKTPLAASGADGRPHQGAIGEVSDDTRWVFTPTGDEDGTYYIDRAAGGAYMRLQLGGNGTPKMKPESKTGTWVRFSLTEASGDNLYLDSGADDPHKRLHFASNGTTAAVGTAATGWTKKFTIKEAENIINDQRWYDTDGDEIRAGKGGQLSHIDGTWYWIGTNPSVLESGGDLHLYASDTLGDGTWEHLAKVVDVAPTKKPAANCSIVKHPDGYYVIIGKGNTFYQSEEVDGSHAITGPYAKVSTTNVTSYQYRSTFDDNGEVVPGSYKHKFGGGSLFIDDDGEAYYITSRLNKDHADVPAEYGVDNRNRNVGIYQLTDDWLDYKPETEQDTAQVYWGPNIGREAMFLFKREGTYYMMSSHTSGWDPSRTYYRTADELSGPWSEELELAFVPGTRDSGYTVKSHGVQFRYMIDIGDGNWMYGGDRYAIEEDEDCRKAEAEGETCKPAVWDAEYGRHMRLPVVWDGDTPTVYWRYEWNVGVYDYTDTSSEAHDPIPGLDK